MFCQQAYCLIEAFVAKLKKKYIIVCIHTLLVLFHKHNLIENSKITARIVQYVLVYKMFLNYLKLV